MKVAGLFVTGTDTGVGKTWLTTRLIQDLRNRGIDAVGMKPVESGGREDAQAILEASATSRLQLDDINPYWFEEPVGPSIARNDVHIDFKKILTEFEKLQKAHDLVIVEGAGGWLAPLDDKRTIADLAIAIGLPVLIVAANKLGAINHSMLTVRAVQQSNLPCHGIFLNEFCEAPDFVRKSNALQVSRSMPDISLYSDDGKGIVNLADSLL